MAMTFTDALVRERVELHNLRISQHSTPRETLANYIEERYKDYVEGWEVRTGRPWNEMTKEEAKQLTLTHPSLLRNPGILSILLS